MYKSEVHVFQFSATLYFCSSSFGGKYCTFYSYTLTLHSLRTLDCMLHQSQTSAFLNVNVFIFFKSVP